MRHFSADAKCRTFTRQFGNLGDAHAIMRFFSSRLFAGYLADNIGCNLLDCRRCMSDIYAERFVIPVAAGIFCMDCYEITDKGYRGWTLCVGLKMTTKDAC